MHALHERPLLPIAKSKDFKDRSVYLGQYIFITREIEKVIDQILEKSSSPPVIVLQSDHGIRWDPDNPSTYKIFNAYYLPDNGNKLLYDNISPVNTFRLIFNHYLKSEFNPIKESSN